MKRLIFRLLLSLSLIPSGHCFAQNHCIPLDESRWLHEQALKANVLDSIVHYQGKQIILLESHKVQTVAAYTDLLANVNERLKLQKENTGHMERLALSYKGQMEYYQKREKKQRKKKNILGGALVVVIVLTLIK